jgi:hypothetical protein
LAAEFGNDTSVFDLFVIAKGEPLENITETAYVRTTDVNGSPV